MDDTFRSIASIVKENITRSESWLVMADWLMEHDDIRGELIRLRYRIRSSIDSNVDIHVIQQLRQSMDIIISGNRIRWINGMPHDMGAINTLWENGFITEITSYKIDLQDVIDGFEHIYNHMTYAVIQSISVGGLGLCRDNISNFVNSSINKLNLIRLSLCYNSIDAYCVEQMLTSGCIDKTKILLLSCNTLNDDGVRVIADSGHACNIHSISLDQNNITDTGVKYLLDFAKSNQSLRYINLSYNPLIRNRACVGDFYDMGIRITI